MATTSERSSNRSELESSAMVAKIERRMTTIFGMAVILFLMLVLAIVLVLALTLVLVLGKDTTEVEKGQQPTSAMTMDLSETNYPTPPVTNTTTTATTTVTTTLPPAGPPEIACFYDISNVAERIMFDWRGANICKDIHVRMTVLPNGELGGLDKQIYWQLAFPNDHVYFMYLWEEIHGGRDLRGLKKAFDNRNRKYSLGWLNNTHLFSVATLQAFVDVFKSYTTGDDSGICLGLNLNEDNIQRTRELLSMIGNVSPKFTVLLIKFEDYGERTCQIFPYSSKNRTRELTNLGEWPAPLVLPVTAAVYRTTSNAPGGGVCVSVELSQENEWYCRNTTDESVFTTVEGKMFAAENRKSLKELKHQYRDWRTPKICVLNMEFFYFPQECMTRNVTDFIL